MHRISNGFFTGINYWGSKKAINMWREFDRDSIEKDLSVLREAGVTHLRVFPLWSEFQPLRALYGPDQVYEYCFEEEPLPDTATGRAGVSEQACEKFETFCALAEKYGMKLIVALVTGHMSFRTYAPPAFEGKALLSDPTVLKWQRRFVRYFVTRMKTQRAIVGWDLGNEPIHMPGLTNNPDTFYVWCAYIADAVKSCDDRPVISGLDNANVERGSANLRSVADTCDIHTTHPYHIFGTAADPLPTMKPILDLAMKCRMGEDIAGIPTFVQEFSSIGYTNCSEKTEADFYRGCLLTSLSHGCHGTMWWCAFDQGHLDDAPYRWNNIGSDYGFFDRYRSPKPVAKENLAFTRLLSQLPEGTLPSHRTDGVILVPRDDGGVNIDTLRATYMLAKQANMDMSFGYALDPIPDAPLYILPSVSHNKTIPKGRIDELLQRVEGGATLYLSMDTGLFRRLPEITGVTVGYRQRVDEVRSIRLGEDVLPVQTTFAFHIEQAKAQVLARDETGEGVLFRYPYGKGNVCLLTLPLEKYLAGRKGAFYAEGQPRYDAVYRTLASLAGIDRVADSDHPHVRLTEHPIDGQSAYVFAINYANRKAEARLCVKQGWRLTPIFGNDVTDGILALRENDGALFKAVKI